MSWDQDLLDKVDCNNTKWPSSNVSAAHNAMQVHLECVVGECPAKTAARDKLVAEGRLVPDSGRI